MIYFLYLNETDIDPIRYSEMSHLYTRTKVNLEILFTSPLLQSLITKTYIYGLMQLLLSIDIFHRDAKFHGKRCHMCRVPPWLPIQLRPGESVNPNMRSVVPSWRKWAVNRFYRCPKQNCVHLSHMCRRAKRIVNAYSMKWNVKSIFVRLVVREQWPPHPTVWTYFCHDSMAPQVSKSKSVICILRSRDMLTIRNSPHWIYLSRNFNPYSLRINNSPLINYIFYIIFELFA